MNDINKKSICLSGLARRSLECNYPSIALWEDDNNMIRITTIVEYNEYARFQKDLFDELSTNKIPNFELLFITTDKSEADLIYDALLNNDYEETLNRLSKVILNSRMKRVLK